MELYYVSLLTVTCLLLHSVSADSDHCKTLATDVLVRKDKVYEYKGQKVRLKCTGIVTMNKCEGLCMSRVSPSVVTFPGFKKDCKCCRESRLEDRRVTLSQCSDGVTDVPGQFTTMFIREPTSCQCYDCAI